MRVKEGIMDHTDAKTELNTAPGTEVHKTHLVLRVR